jgi:hypothetical protein
MPEFGVLGDLQCGEGLALIVGVKDAHPHQRWLLIRGNTDGESAASCTAQKWVVQLE